ncbi:MAG: putative polyketide hydroxylase [Actinomycetota bacterium]|jgi:2-polyprenyl-6-methoxyphenol hydroxylase-like FAD-dependent oxidoreductase|nr:putative polyketide hydroxylase [Actinomycetota bacterium]
MPADPLTDVDVDVLVIGGGPVGLATAALLGGLGIDTRLVERHPTTSNHPRGFGIHPRTMEVFRRLGVAAAIRANGLPPEVAGGFGFVTRLNGGERARLMLGPMPDHFGPEQGCFCPQYRYEQILRARAEEHPGVSLAFGAEATGLDVVDGRANVQITHAASGDTTTVTSRYVVAADGMHSPMRTMLGVTETSTGAFGHSVSVYFRADLSRFRKARPFALTWTIDPGAEGTLGIAAADGSEWTFTFAADPNDDFGDADLQERIRAAVGDSGVDIEVLDVLRWDYEQAVTDQWRMGPVFFCGDAAHRFPPHGGFGMNSGVQDAENLAWKLAAVLRWGAAERLLDTYETERKPVAIHNGQRALINTQRLADANWEPEHAAASLEDQHEHFLSIGQQMGTIYRSAAIVDDGTESEASTVTNYVESGRPGARAPHVTLEDVDGRRISTIDACAGAFVVLSGDPRAESQASDVPLAVLDVGPGRSYRCVDRPWQDAYGVKPEGAVVIRPDGHVAARFQDASGDAVGAARRAMGAMLQA